MGYMDNKRGQMKLSFGMIFSIILIVVFIIFAFYAIRKIVGVQQVVQIETFVKDLQEDVDRAYYGARTAQNETYTLPNKIEAVCFADRTNNLLFRPLSEKISAKNIDNINILEITLEKDPYCVSNTGGEVKLIISKGSNEDLVTITRQ